MLPKTSAYVKRYDWQTKWMYFLIEDDGLLEKSNTIWAKFSSDIKKNLIASLSIIKISLIKNRLGDQVNDFWEKNFFIFWGSNF